MNILEIINTDVQTVNVKNGKLIGSIFKPSKEFDKHGKFSKIKDDPISPHFVLKLETKRDDAYWEFVEFLIKNKLFSNPHFPRIYDVKKYVDDTGKMARMARIEKLFPISSLSNEEVVSILENNFVDFIVTNIKSSALSKSDMVELISGALSDAIDSSKHPDKYITNKQLSDAVASIRHFIRRVNKLDGLVSDIHSGNLMVRRTPYGAQIVFIDPVWLERN